MAALIASLIELLTSILFKSQFILSESKKDTFSIKEYSENLAKPPIYHKILEENFLNQFDEIIVIGDIHGCYDEMIKLIELVEMNKKNPSGRILKLFVGDLINKGPKNKEVIDYIMNHKDECLSVRGNHEEISIKTYYFYLMNSNKDTVKKSVLKYEWAKDLNKEQLNFLISLPYTISLPTENCIIVHAGLIAGLPLEKHDPYDLVHMRNYLFEDYFEGKGLQAVKSCSIGEPWAPNWPGPQHVYFGHNSKRGLQKCKFATGIDTGCVSGNYLTGIFIKGERKNELIQIKPEQAYKKKN